MVVQGPPFAELQADVTQGQTVPIGFKAPPIALAEVVQTADENDYRQRRETIYVFQPEVLEQATLGLAHNGRPR